MSKACAIVELSRRAWYREDPAERQLATDQPIIDAERVNLKWTVCFKLIVNFLELPEALGS